MNVFGKKSPNKTPFDQVRQIFIMGPPKSGKSTFFNQLKRIYGDEREMDAKHMKQRKEMVELYIFHAIAEIVAAMPKLSPPIRLQTLTNLALASWFIYHSRINFNVDRNKVVIFFHFIEFFKNLWNDEGFQSALERSKEYNIPLHAKYFFSHVDRIFSKDYIPTEEDILKAYIFPSTTQKLEIGYIDLTNRNKIVRRHLRSDIVEIKGSVSYRVIDLAGETDDRKCLPCLYDEEIKRDMDYVPWFRQRPKFTNYSIIFLIDGSTEETRREGLELLKTTVERYNCCCFMILPIISKWDIAEEATLTGDDDSYNNYNLLDEFKRPIQDGLRDIHWTMCPRYNRKSREWVVERTSHHKFLSVLDTDVVKKMFERCCGDIEQIEIRAQFEQQFRKSCIDHGLRIIGMLEEMLEGRQITNN